MPFNCFRPSGNKSTPDEFDAPSRPSTFHTRRTNTSSSRMMRRHASADSQSSASSNDSISRLPPCDRSSYPKIEAMMMPLPEEVRASRCLRMSHPRIYSNIVEGMKESKGCRDWRNFAVFHLDDVDESCSAEEVAHKRAADYERKLRQLSSNGESVNST